MILRSVTQHVRDQNWFAVFLDFFIVVVGVFVGIQVSNWDQERKNNALAADYVQRIKVDIHEQISFLKHVADYYQLTYRHGQAAVDAFSKSDESLNSQFLIDLYQASQRLNVETNESTYDELLATGRIVNIKNPRIRNLITNYYRRISSSNITINETTPYRRTIRLYMAARIQAQIIQNCGDIYNHENETSYFLTLPEDCEIAVAEDILLPEISQLKTNSEIKQELSFHLTVLKGKLGSIQNAIDISNITLQMMNEEQR